MGRHHLVKAQGDGRVPLLALGDHVPARLKFEKAGEVEVSFIVGNPPAEATGAGTPAGMGPH